tara:strand:- start:113 stop:385 length:273 start_codon:yes stop_codon:yes gene_type:complete
VKPWDDSSGVPQKFGDVRAVADILNCSTPTVWRRAADGTLPASHKLGRLRRWWLPDIYGIARKEVPMSPPNATKPARNLPAGIVVETHST